MNNFFRQPVLVAGLIAFTTTVIVGSAAHVFPEVAQRITVWQVELIESPKPHPAITMINLKPQDALSCGKTIWNRALLAQMITALSQAEAKFIAPMLLLKGPSFSACGGASADAKLIEATTQSGRVIYPNSAFEPIKNQALAVGYVGSRPVRETQLLPLGVAIAKEYDKETILDYPP
jgi:CHASE2 domain-containing sensor protein